MPRSAGNCETAVASGIQSTRAFVVSGHRRQPPRNIPGTGDVLPKDYLKKPNMPAIRTPSRRPDSGLGVVILATLMAMLAGSPSAQSAASRTTQTLRLELVAKHGNGSLYRCGEQRVLVLRGSPRQMGRQHGKLLAKDVRTVTVGTLAWVARRGLSRAELQTIAHSLNPHLPERYKQELRGLAEGSGAPLDDLILVHAMPSKFHCSGAAVANSMTRDGKLYHTRSLDYALDVGEHDRLQNHALLIVRQPDDGIANAVPAWAGFLGSVTGLNMRGISIGEMGSNSDDESYAGVPMIFLVREVLRRGKTLDEAVGIIRKGPRTCGFNFIVDSGQERNAVAIEVTRSHFFMSGMGDKKENVAPHSAMPDTVRRSNHFVSKKLAATQRKVYDPRKSKERSWALYEKITAYLRRNRGKLDAAGMVGQLRLYPPHMGCLHQAVMAATDKIIWVSQAKDGRHYPFPGAQNQAFYRYDLATLLREPETLEVSVLLPKHVAAAGNPPARRISVEHHKQEIPYLGTMVQAGAAGKKFGDSWKWGRKPGHFACGIVYTTDVAYMFLF